MPATSYTLATLRTEVLEEVQDSTGEHYTATIVKKRINNRMADFTRRTGCRRHTWEIDLVASQAEYSFASLSPRVVDVYSVACPMSAGSTDQYELRRMELTDLERDYPQWRTEADSWPRVYARFTEGSQGILLHPRPASSQAASVRSGTIAASQTTGILVGISGLTTAQATAAYGILVGVSFLVGNLRIDGAALSTDLDDDADSLETDGGIPIEWQPYIKAGVLADLCGDLSVPIAQVAKADQYEAKYEAGVQMALRRFQSSHQGRPATQGKARFL
jgi:hypothetical protein